MAGKLDGSNIKFTMSIWDATLQQKLVPNLVELGKHSIDDADEDEDDEDDDKHVNDGEQEQARNDQRRTRK